MNGVQHQLFLDLGLVVVHFQAAQSGQDVLALLDFAFRDEISWRFWKVRHSDDDDNAKDNLEGNWESPREIGWAVMGTKIDPVCDHTSNGNHAALNADEQATVARLGAFCLVGGDGGGVHAIPDSGNGSAHDELRQGNVTGEGGDLDDDSHDHDTGTANDHPASTETITKDQGKDGAEEAS